MGGYPEMQRGYYLTAYGIAVKHGFSGTEEEWLNFLKANVELRYADGVLQWCNAGVEDWHTLQEFTAFQADIQAKGESAQTAAQAADDAARASREQTQSAAIAEAQRAAAENVRRAAENGRNDEESLRAKRELERRRGEESRLSEESARQLGESNRVRGEQERKAGEAGRTEAEGLRREREQERQEGESQRAQGESQRVLEEERRISREAQRLTAETARAEGEALRERGERLRAGAESERLSAEEQRLSGEAERAAAEEGRLSAENARAGSEQARAGAETARAEAEQAREQAERERRDWQEANTYWGNYSADKQYLPGNKVVFNGSSYMNLAPCVGIAPTNREKWRLFAAKGQDGQGSGDMLSSVYDPTGRAQDAFAYTDAQVGKKPDKSRSGEGRLLAEAWVNDSPPFVMEMALSDIKAGQNGVLGLSQSITKEELEAACDAELHISGQTDGGIVISAFGKKPETDIPIAFTLLG